MKEGNYTEDPVVVAPLFVCPRKLTFMLSKSVPYSYLKFYHSEYHMDRFVRSRLMGTFAANKTNP